MSFSIRIVGLILFITFLISSCGKNSSPPPDTNIRIFYKNSSGSYFFANNSNGFKEDSVKVLKVINGISYPLDSGYAYMFNSSKDLTKRSLYLAFMDWATINNATNIVLIRLKYNVIDTLKYYGKVSNSLNYDSITYNGIKQSSSVFEITK